MNHNIKRPINEELLSQLVYLDEQGQELMETYFANDRIKFKEFYHLYTTEVEAYISNLHAQKKQTNKLEKVFIGCKVIVKYEDDDETEEYIICFPEQSNPDEGCISFLSPVGNQLLLRSVGEHMKLNTPGGEIGIVITDIQF
ncbi:GreA/GreB family elongation factor [Metabacillus malikii]|uniref:Transcription elongation factor GreA n=1 Tax=Metabacillus malikii TaxID=1504265 RepID=A0ABT9ZDV7_9BACI|nr:GreA/GreB family elongation factor [Metabacillus malikii]MDQ0229430.1 transcription elongation factor GreA [Metabacillus malikii]